MMADLIPGLDDTALANLRANATRLEAGVEGKRQKQAAELLPLIEAEIEARKAAKPPVVSKRKKVVAS